MKNRRQVCIQVKVKFSDAEAVLDLLDELGVKAETRLVDPDKGFRTRKKKRAPRRTFVKVTSPKQAREIMQLKKLGMSRQEILKKTGIGRGVCDRILNGSHPMAIAAKLQ